MNPPVMLGLIAVFLAMFAYSANRRYQLMRAVGKPENRLDQLGRRFRAVVEYAMAQKKMRKYPVAGAAHTLIFVGFVVLLLRSLVLFGRGFDLGFDLWVLGEDGFLGRLYGAIKDWSVLGVLGGTAVFVYYRAFRKLGRMTLGFAGLLYPLGALLAGFIPSGFQQKMLAFVAGDFIYIGAGDLLPEAHRRFNWKVILLVILGMTSLFILKLLFP